MLERVTDDGRMKVEVLLDEERNGRGRNTVEDVMKPQDDEGEEVGKGLGADSECGWALDSAQHRQL